MIGLFGLSAQEIKDATRFLSSRDFDRVFDEKTQSVLVKELIRQRANRTNSIRGAIIQAKKGGEATIFRGDEREGREPSHCSHHEPCALRIGWTSPGEVAQRGW